MSWKYVLAGVAAVGALGAAGKVGFDLYSDRKSEERAKRAAEENRVKAQAKKAAERFEATWKPRFHSLLVIDSNIWMERTYDSFFSALIRVLENFSTTLRMSSIQFDEIVNLKNLPYNNDKSKLARRAMAQIEELQKLGLLEIVTIGVEARKGAYADRSILDALAASVPERSSVALVSDDRELRIRATQILKDEGASDFVATSGRDFQTELFAYVANCDRLKQCDGPHQ